MEKKKITKKMEEKLLKILYRRYLEEYGYGVRHLDKYEILVTGAEIYVDEMPEIYSYDKKNQTKYSLLMPILDELQAKKFVRGFSTSTGFEPRKYYYYLTEDGYIHASKSKLDHFISYLSQNTGWAIPVAALSLVISIIALFF